MLGSALDHLPGKQMRPLKMMTTPKAVALPYSLSWDYYF